MKRIYEKPYVEVIEFETEDAITTSGGGAIIDTPFEPVIEKISE